MNMVDHLTLSKIQAEKGKIILFDKYHWNQIILHFIPLKKTLRVLQMCLLKGWNQIIQEKRRLIDTFKTRKQ